MKYLAALLAGIVSLLAFQHVTPSFGAFSPTGGGTYRIASSIGTANSSIRLSSFKEPVSNLPYTMSYLGSDIGYGTLDPQTTRSEFVSFTGVTQNSDGSATLTGVTRGLTRTPAGSACTASTTLAQAHPGQSTFILSNSPCFYAEYLTLRTNATSSAILMFSSTTPPRFDSVAAQASGTYIATTSELVTWAGLAAVANAGTVNATQIVKGIVELATQTEAASSTALGGTGASLALTTSLATDTPNTATRASRVLMSDMLGYLKQGWLNLTEAFTFSGGILSTASSTFTATTSIAAGYGKPLSLNGTQFIWPSTVGATGTMLSITSASSSVALGWTGPSRYIASGISASGVNNGYSTSTTVLTIPSGYLAASSTIRVMGGFKCTSDGNAVPGSCYVFIRNNTTGTEMASTTISPAANAIYTLFTTVNFTIYPQTSALSGVYFGGTISGVEGGNTYTMTNYLFTGLYGMNTISLTGSIPISIVVRSDNTHSTAYFDNGTIEVTQ
jgi:hypothetical protein